MGKGRFRYQEKYGSVALMEVMLAFDTITVVGVWRGPGLARPQFDRLPLTIFSPFCACNMPIAGEGAGGLMGVGWCSEGRVATAAGRGATGGWALCTTEAMASARTQYHFATICQTRTWANRLPGKADTLCARNGKCDVMASRVRDRVNGTPICRDSDKRR
ncbi:hypothetical protein L226DRAFT_267170 [Lentinus tigrinus ALCF2SS1-7]|uniref:uncharacterized protein n=1 Tax=Lentinus tigrinus ALCF2SS1-7 TaxID=1328758 RepID=UPI0011661BF7|nr:hypothetical protein L226DRAFT_267170 [Lentinus tigrinus ALCF2SS1-7]